jgi:hypothetical protein
MDFCCLLQETEHISKIPAMMILKILIFMNLEEYDLILRYLMLNLHKILKSCIDFSISAIICSAFSSFPDICADQNRGQGKGDSYNRSRRI